MAMRLIVRAAAVLIALSLAPSIDAAQRRVRDRDRVCVYQDIHYRGWEQCYVPGDEVIDLRDRRNSISSIRMFGRARLVIYDNSQFRGQSMEITSDVPDLDLRSITDSRTWNDRIDSLRIASDFPPPTRTGSVCVFEHAYFRGRTECFDSGVEIRELRRNGDWNDRISSIQIVGNARAIFYENIGFQGEQLVVDRDIPDLAILRLRDGVNWNDQASSVEVRGSNRR
jgi:hypothetical protein